MEVDTIHHQLLVAFGRSNHAMISRTREFGLMPGQPKVLEYVAEHEGRMEEAGLVERRPKAGDRRALEVHLTDSGWAEAEHVACCGAEVDAVAHRGMTAEEREELSRLLARVIENFEEAERESVHE